jgi:hypothetical protein
VIISVMFTHPCLTLRNPDRTKFLSRRNECICPTETQTTLTSI